jgi:hypothetical protein
VFLHVVRSAPAVLLFDDVAGFSEVIDEVKSPALRDPESGREVASAQIRILGKAEQSSAVIGQEASRRHQKRRIKINLEIIYV